MKQGILLFIVLLVLNLAQASFLPLFPVAGWVLNLPLLFVALFAFFAPFPFAAFAALMTGFFFDVFSSGLFGFWQMTLLLLVALIHYFIRNYVRLSFFKLS